jgi:hypothetical protein
MPPFAGDRPLQPNSRRRGEPKKPASPRIVHGTLISHYDHVVEEESVPRRDAVVPGSLGR